MPSLNSAPQTVPQLIPVNGGCIVTVPSTEPVFVTSSSIDVIGPHETVSRVDPTIFWDSAETVVVPQDTAVADPVLLTVATGILLEDHVVAVLLVRSISPPLTSVPKATNCVVCPICGIVGLLGRIVMDCRPGGPPAVTVRLAVPTTTPDDEDMVAVMEVVPELTATAAPTGAPGEEKVATAWLLEAQVTEFVMSVVLGGWM